MIAIRKYENFLAFNLEEIGDANFFKLIVEACNLSNKLSTDDFLEIDEQPAFITQIPYNSGFIQERAVYYINNSISNHIITAAEKKEDRDLFFNKNLCWDWYDGTTLILSLNIVQNVITVNTQAIELMDYNDYEEKEYES